MSTPATRRIPVVGIGADGLDGLSPRATELLRSAPAVHGSARQLELLAELDVPLHEWPSPLLPALPRLAEEIAATGAAVVASGDPMFHGIGSTLARVIGPERIEVYPAPSSVSLAAARIGWPLHEVGTVSCVTADPSTVLAALARDRRVFVLARDRHTPVEVARVLTAAGAGAAALTVLAELGGPGESRHRDSAARLAEATPAWTDLCVLAVDAREVGPGADRSALPGPSAGLPDSAYETDGQLTKQHVRAATLAALAPRPGEHLWDVGGGTGTIGIEWMRLVASARASVVEPRAERCTRIAANARALGVPALRVVHGHAPEALADLATPDAVFLGGGVTTPGVVEVCRAALPPGGRLVAAAVTLESEAVLVELARTHRGRLTRLAVEYAETLGRFTAWTPARAVTHLEIVKEER